MQYRLLNNPITGQPLQTAIAGIADDGTVMSIPNDDHNVDWLAYQSWLADGNAPLPAA